MGGRGVKRRRGKWELEQIAAFLYNIRAFTASRGAQEPDGTPSLSQSRESSEQGGLKYGGGGDGGGGGVVVIVVAVVVVVGWWWW